MSDWQIIVDEMKDLIRATQSLRITSMPSPPPHGAPVIILRGYLADYLPGSNILYSGMVRVFRMMGLNAHCPMIHVSAKHYRESAQIVDDVIGHCFPSNRSVTLVGHSYGGVLANLVKIDPNAGKRIGNVYTIGTPYGGTPFKTLARLVRRTTGASEELVEIYKKALLAASSDITSIVSSHDAVAPPSAACLAHPESKMRLVNVSDHFPGLEIGHAQLVADEEVRWFIGELIANDLKS